VVGVRAADRRGHAGIGRDRGPEVDEPRSLQITLDPDDQFTPGSPRPLNSAARRQPSTQPAEPTPAPTTAPTIGCVADVLSGGPPPGSRRPPRWALIAGTAVLATVAALLAARSTPEKVQAAPSPPAPAPVLTRNSPGVVAVAVGTRWAYALVAECDPEATRACGYRLHRRSFDGRPWTALPLVTETRTTLGVVPTLVVSGEDVVTVLEQSTSGRVYSFLDGVGASQHQLGPGPPIDAVPPDGLLDSALCDRCRERIVVLEPATGRLRPLRNQPFPAAGVRAYGLRGGVAWAVSTTGTDTTSAVSLDRGRSWRTVPVPGLAPGIDALQLVPGASGDAYLLGSTTQLDGDSRLVGVWAISGPARRWELQKGPAPLSVRSALAGERGLLISDLGGTVWRLEPTGAFAALPDPGPTRPADLATGPARMIAATPRGRIPDLIVLTSYDEGESWRAERIG
jgi:hypothetical protein